jgi:alpha-tubulin suppressor-like RCC1 family protein
MIILKPALFWAGFFLLGNLNSTHMLVGGNSHVIILEKTSDVYTIGRNNFEQLGDSSYINSPVPIKVERLPKIKVISRGCDHFILGLFLV